MLRSRQIKAYFLLTVFVFQTFFPTVAHALTGGPSQPEVQSFEPAGTSEMVDLSTGTFTYNIPLLDVGGYPVNLAYHAGATMDQEASCVGLGWNINPGVINRNMRGLPDDFDGEEVLNEFSLTPNRTWGGKIGADFEIFGSDRLKIGLQAGVFYNNYKGVGLEYGISGSASGQASKWSKDKFTSGLGLNLNLNVNSQNGVTAGAAITPSFGFGKWTDPSDSDIKSQKEFGISGGLSYNSKQGLMAATMGANMSFQGVDNCHQHSSGRTIGLGSSTFSFARPTYMPSARMAVSNFSFTLRSGVQTAAWGFDPGISITGYFSRQRLASKSLKTRAYGTLYLQNHQPGKSLLDFNRERDGSFTENTPNLAVPVPAQDIYSVSGQGIGGNYLLKRSDIGVFSDRESVVQSGSGSVSLEVGAGNFAKFGLDVVGVGVEAKSGSWTGNSNNMAPKLAFKGPAPDSLYEPAYFKPAGEKSVEGDPALFNAIGGFDVVDAQLGKDPNDKFNVKVNPAFRVGNNAVVKQVSSKVFRNAREKRNQNISYSTAEEATEFGLQKYIENYPRDTFNVPPKYLNRVDGVRKAKHISEISSIREDGMRYIYGLPAYNIKQQDYQFSVAGARDCKTGLVTYTLKERSKNNTSGQENYYSMEETPAYAHAFLLTAVLSPEYADIDGVNGPSTGDVGNYTKFNYSRVQSKYKWRLPVPDGNQPGNKRRANFSPGLLSDPKDNRGSVIYGEKEVWQLHSIESKAYVAKFYYSNRKDGIGMSDIDSLIDENTQRLVQLDSIVLFSKLEIARYGHAAAVPLKKVTFEYDNTLSGMVPNTIGANQGKLKLKKVYFTYGRSQKGRFSPYQFEYNGNTLLSPGDLNYNNLAYNRWGSYQKSFKAGVGDCDDNDAPGNDDAPYVVQDSLTQAKYAVAWNLTGIVLPSGGRIDVTYESHDYAYTQNKDAMEMFKIEGLGKDSIFAITSELYSPAPPPKIQYHYIYFKLKAPILNGAGQNVSALEAQNIVERDYIKDIKGGNLYFKAFVNLKSIVAPGCPAGGCPKYEYVFGYGQVESWGRCPNNFNYGYIRLKLACVKDKDNSSNCTKVNPISKAGWQFTRIYAPNLIHQSNLSSNLPVDEPNSIKDFIKMVEAFSDLYKGLEVTLTGLNQFCLKNNYAQRLELQKSWIRLYNPNGKKLAGGSRVKRLVISDNWQTMSTVADKGVYGQEFDYRTELDLGKNLGDNKTKRVISSGVASYEPMIGNDENPWRQPEYYDEKLLLAPDNRYYQESPMGETFFPSPVIVYSKVTVNSLKYNNAGILVNPTCVSTGKTISEYYTAKDFPVKVNKTPIQVWPAKSSPLVSFLKLDYKEYLNASQGFCVELNDMHGKPKAQWVYDDKGQRISGLEYIYKTKKKDIDPSPAITKLVPVVDSLDNRVTVINRNGNITSAQMGVDFQMVADSRESSHETRTRGVAMNVDVFLFGLFPFAAIMPWPTWETEKTRFRSMAVTKVITRTGLLEKVIAYDASSRIETENLAWDAETGDILLTKTYNEYGDPLYKLKYPAHFVYKGMRPAYENCGLEIANAAVIPPPGNAVGTAIQLNAFTIKYMEPGDELKMSSIVNGDTTIVKGWVLNALIGPNVIHVIDKQGFDLPFPVGTFVNFKILRSGKRNLQNLDVGVVTLKENPIQGPKLDFTVNSVKTKVLDASSTEYSDYWQYQSIPGCTDILYEIGLAKGGLKSENFTPTTVHNPYNVGRRGVWRAKKSWVYLKDRTPIAPPANYQTNIRSTGVFEDFNPFWVISGENWNSSTSNWTWSSEVTKYNNYGFQLESRDQLNRFSSELPGYNNTQAIAVAANARYREIQFDGYEEIGLDFLNICSGSIFKHFPLLNGAAIDSAYSHTGDYAVRLNANSSAFYDDFVTYIASTGDPLLGNPPATESRISSIEFLPKFGLQLDSAYVFSAWVRTNETYAINKVTYKQANELNPRIEVELKNNQGTLLSTLKLHPTGPVINGWQRITGVVTMPSVIGFVTVRFKNGTTNIAYFDDFRIQPFRSAMKTFVYDLKSTRLMATLDDENFATFYEYDQQGMLERVKRETERGIMTIQETRSGIKKQ